LKGDTGLQGIQGVQGVKGNDGAGVKQGDDVEYKVAGGQGPELPVTQGARL
jgi:hypothetical protein